MILKTIQPNEKLSFNDWAIYIKNEVQKIKLKNKAKRKVIYKLNLK